MIVAATIAACRARGDDIMHNDGVTRTDDESTRFSAAIRKVADPIGEGGRGYYPYQLRGEILEQVRTLHHPLEVYASLLATTHDSPWREVVVLLIGFTDDPRADALLVTALDDPSSRPLALYCLGAIGGKGWPSRDRDVPLLLAAITRHLEDRTPYTDHITHQAFQTADFARAAYLRIAGLAHSPAVENLAGMPDDPTGRFIGSSLPSFTADDRTRIDAAIARDRTTRSP
jgi:hypothetical protein